MLGGTQSGQRKAKAPSSCVEAHRSRRGHHASAALRYLSVCSGIEAATVAWHHLGWEPAAFSEIEKFPRAVMAHHYPDVPCHGDFTTIEGEEYGPIDLVCGGTPCQSFSVAGLRGGMDDERGNLSLEFLRLAERTGARWVVWENVPGVLSIDGGRAFGAILGGLGQLGYGFAYRVLDAQHFGVPQRRRRIFLVGYLGDWRRAAAVLFERHSLQGHPAPRREAGQSAPTIPARSTGGGGLGTDFDCDGGLIAEGFGGGNTSGPIDVAACLTAKGQRVDFEVETFIAHSLRAEGFDASEDGTGRGTPLVPVAFSAKDYGADAMEDCAPTLRAGGHRDSHANAGVMPAVALMENQHAEIRLSDCTDAMATGGGKPGQGYPAAFNGSAVRRLTPIECERLQGFPDNYTRVPWRGKPAEQCPDGPRYKALGNSWAVPVARWVGERIAMVEALHPASFDNITRKLTEADSAVPSSFHDLELDDGQ